MTRESGFVTFTRPELERLKVAYKQAAERHTANDSFTFDGHTFVIAYAKYLIEYLEARLPK